MMPSFLTAVSLSLLFLACAPAAAHAASQNSRVRRQLRHQLATSAATRAHASHRGEYDDDKDNADDDSSDDAEGDSDDKQEEVAEERAEAVEFAAQEKQHDDERKAEETGLQLKVKRSQEVLANTTAKLTELEASKAHLTNKRQSDQEIDSSVRLVANETESKAMAGMLGNMWKEMRMYEAPAYTLYLEEQIGKLNSQKGVQEEDLAKAHEALAAKQREWKDADEAVAPLKKVQAPSIVTTTATTTAMADKSQKPWEPWWMKQKVKALSGGLVYIAFGIMVAYFYWKARDRKGFMHVQLAPGKDGGWARPLFGCYLNRTLCLAGFCCPCIRWADTIDKAGAGWTYWPAFMVMFLLMVLDMYAYGIAGLVIVFLGVRFRQKLRAQYKLPYGSMRSYAQDIAVWFCCAPCAIIQEAHEEAAQR